MVRDSVIMNEAWIGPGAIIDRSVVDKEVQVGPGAQLGVGDDNTPNAEMPDKLFAGITVVGKAAHLPANIRVGRNVLIHADVDEDVVNGYKHIPSGSTITRADVLIPPPAESAPAPAADSLPRDATKEKGA